MMYGYDNIANGASIAMPGFLLFFGEIGPTGPFLPTLWTSLWTSMSVLFQAVGAFSFGFIQDRFGRKWSGVGAAALTVAGTGLQYVSHTPAELLGGKIINGFAIGAGWAVATTYASEVSGTPGHLHITHIAHASCCRSLLSASKPSSSKASSCSWSS